jgi:very-short-patch-repair endonuclease
MNEEMHRDAKPILYHYARLNRKVDTEAEAMLWNRLRGRKLNGFKFRRQHPIEEFIADFYCHECNLVVELDGEYHSAEDQQSYDEGRTYNLEGLGIKVIRFKNSEIRNGIEEVLQAIAIHLIPFPSPPQKGDRF